MHCDVKEGKQRSPTSNELCIVGQENTTLGAVQVNVVDYKPFSDSSLQLDPAELRDIHEACRSLLDDLRMYTKLVSADEDKVSSRVELVSNQVGDRLCLMLKLGKAASPFRKDFELPLPQSFRGFSAKSLHDALNRLGRVDPGGNVPNMVRNSIHLQRCGLMPENYNMKLFTTDEPVFMEWLEKLEPAVRERITTTRLNIESRTALHLPYLGENGKIETMGLVSPMLSTKSDVEAYMSVLAGCNHALVSECLEANLKTEDLRRNYQEFQNPSSAFREQCAGGSYEMMVKGAHNIPFVSLNNTEMVRHLDSIERRRDLVSRGSSGGNTADGEEPQIKRKLASFSVPFDANREINGPTVDDATESFVRYFNCITPSRKGNLYFPLSVTCKADGGYTVACTESGQKIVIFSSVPTKSGNDRMLELIGENNDISADKMRTMGAGDSVASVLSAVHLWDTKEMLGRLRNKDRHPTDPKFLESASIVFVSLLTRYAGAILVHSDRCDWSSVPEESFRAIIAKTAQKSLDIAADNWREEGLVVTRDPEWDIDIAMWKL